MFTLNMSEGQARLRGQLAAAKGAPCILKNDLFMLRALVGLDNREFGCLQRSFAAGWNEGAKIAQELRATDCP